MMRNRAIGRWLVLGQIVGLALGLAAAWAVIAMFGCSAPGSAEAEPEQTVSAEIAPVIEALGNVEQSIQNVQETVSAIEQNVGSQGAELAKDIHDVGQVVQNVQETMYGLSPEMLELEQDRLDAASVRQYQLIGVIIGFLLLALAAPAIGGSFVAFLWIGGIGLIIGVAALPLLLKLLF